ARQLAADISLRALKPLQCILLCLFIAQDADICFACLQIRSHFDSHHGSHWRHPGIFDPSAQDIAQLSLDLSIYSCVFNTVFSHRCSFFLKQAYFLSVSTILYASTSSPSLMSL